MRSGFVGIPEKARENSATFLLDEQSPQKTAKSQSVDIVEVYWLFWWMSVIHELRNLVWQDVLVLLPLERVVEVAAGVRRAVVVLAAKTGGPVDSRAVFVDKRQRAVKQLS
ncbi:Hypothetical_protein [Hexamita inflata]|uniref:Hypothetical_protein n=1 Tax=Hexamita inflata TaxID=28002 RepID=A0AA86QJL2_9EUKA|nr:Hypothetical protein HINF_LOCUS45207 [Hexamita inflata]